jgi:ABC-type nitrate/sulfonate/bicarbonate transport system substrate-binding protein
MLYPPGSFDAASQGYPNIGDLSDYVKDMPFTGYAVDHAWAVKNKPAIIGFLKGWRKAVGWFYDTRNRAEAIAILVKESGQTRKTSRRLTIITARSTFSPKMGLSTPKNSTRSCRRWHR